MGAGFLGRRLVGVGLLVVGLAACATTSAQESAAVSPSPEQLAARPVPRDLTAFNAWLDEFKAEALSKGVGERTIAAALTGVEPIEKVVALDRRQPESTVTFAQYLERVVTSARVARGRALYAENRAVLDAVEKKFGVQARFVVALWGIETDFGRVTGGYPVVPALATLAYDGRRSAFFRSELLDALRILDQGHISPAAMQGSWAGAMGQCQFMPSSFLRFAQDWDGDGRRDIWGTRPDVFASAANYLASSGWKGDETWGRAVRLPVGFDRALANLEIRKSLAEWSRLGVRGADGKPLPARDIPASLVFADGAKGGAPFLVYDNYRVVLKWNRSTFFALAVGHLADKIGAR